MHLHFCMTAASNPVESSVLPGSKYELSTPAPWTHSRSATLHTVHPRGTTERHREREKEGLEH